MRYCIYIMLLVFLSLTFNASKAQAWNNDPNKTAILAIDKIQDNIIAYKTLDSLNKIPTLTARSKTEVMLRLTLVTIKLQKFNEAAKLAFAGVEIAAKNNFDTAYATFYKTIGAIHYYTLKFNEAINYFKRSAALAKQKGILYLEVINYQNIGGVLIDLNKPDSAEIYLKKSIFLGSNCGKKCNTSVLTAYRLLATLYEKQKKYNTALALYEKGEKEARIWNDTTTIGSYLIYYAELLFKLKKNEALAIAKAEEAVKLMRLQNGRNDHSFHAAIILLASKMHKLGRYKEASILKSEADELRKKMFSNENQQQINELETRFKVKELEQEKNLATTTALAEKQQKQILYLLLIGIVLLATLLFTFIYLKNNKKQAEEKTKAQQALLQSILETEEKERSRIAKDLHDGIVQDLTAIKIDLNATISNVPLELQNQISQILKAVDIAAKEVREISYQMMPVTLKELGLIKAMEELLNRTLAKNNILYHFDYFGIEERLPEKIEVTVYRISQELLNNTIKHSRAKNVSILLQVKNNTLQLTYEDDGIGFNSTTIKKGIGLNSLGSRIEMVKGSLEFDTSPNEGTTAYIRIPL